jgi:prepilin-type N-terminal cleavage/methylation domain-containing protein
MKRLLSKGFTLVELLIVMAIIAILAVALLAALNPIEQINRGQDTRHRNNLKEIVSASERYYVNNEEWPWNVDNPTTSWVALDDDPDSLFEIDPSGGAGDVTWAEVLESEASELKTGFYDRFFNDDDDEAYGFYKALNNDVAYGCFLPSSDQYQEQAVDRCEANSPELPDLSWICGGVAPGEIVIDPDAVYWCLP